MKKTIVGSILIALVTMTGTYWYIAQQQEKLESSNSSDIIVGKACSYHGDGVVDTKGLQCYFYGESDAQTGIRPGVWIMPNLRSKMLGSYKDYLSGWKQYQSPDGKIAFEYPPAWFVNTQNWKDGIISILMGQPADIPSFINIEKVEKNAVTMQDRIQDIRKYSSTVLEMQILLQGSLVTRLDVAPTDNLHEQAVYLFIDKGDYYVAVHAPEFNDPLLDFATEYVLSTMLVH